MSKQQTPSPIREIGTYEWLIRFLAALTTFIFGYRYVGALYASVVGPEAAAWLGGIVTTLVIDIGSLTLYTMRVGGRAKTEKQMELTKDGSDILFWVSVAMSVAVLILSVELVTWPTWLLNLAGAVGTVGVIGSVVLNFWTVDQFLKASPINQTALQDAQDKAALWEALRGRLQARRAERLDTIADELFALGYADDERSLIDQIGGTGTAERLRARPEPLQVNPPNPPQVIPASDDLWQSILDNDTRDSDRQWRETGDDAGTFRNGAR